MDADRWCRLLPAVLAEQWGLGPAEVSPLAGGMNSAAARVVAAGTAYAAKWVPEASREALLAGVDAAGRAAAAGVRSGTAVPSGSGEPVVEAAGGTCVLLRWVAGRPLTGEPADEQALIAAALAAVHGATGSGARRGPLLDELLGDEAALGVEPWVRPAVWAARAAYAALPPLSWALLHGDPAPEAFLLDAATGTVGLIDWAGTFEGPVLYDVASAVMYLGGPAAARPFLAAYARTRVLARDELDRVGVLLRLRWAVQAAYFGRRLALGDLTGIADRSGNLAGLADARRGLLGELSTPGG